MTCHALKQQRRQRERSVRVSLVRQLGLKCRQRFVRHDHRYRKLANLFEHVLLKLMRDIQHLDVLFR